MVVHAEEERVADHDQESLGARDGNVEPKNEFTHFWMTLFGINQGSLDKLVIID